MKNKKPFHEFVKECGFKSAKELYLLSCFTESVWYRWYESGNPKMKVVIAGAKVKKSIKYFNRIFEGV